MEKIIFKEVRGWAVGFVGTVRTYDEGVTNDDPHQKPVLQKRNYPPYAFV